MLKAGMTRMTQHEKNLQPTQCRSPSRPLGAGEYGAATTQRRTLLAERIRQGTQQVHVPSATVARADEVAIVVVARRGRLHLWRAGRQPAAHVLLPARQDQT